jgi:hypothetical protein
MMLERHFLMTHWCGLSHITGICGGIAEGTFTLWAYKCGTSKLKGRKDRKVEVTRLGFESPWPALFFFFSRFCIDFRYTGEENA